MQQSVKNGTYGCGLLPHLLRVRPCPKEGTYFILVKNIKNTDRYILHKKTGEKKACKSFSLFHGSKGKKACRMPWMQHTDVRYFGDLPGAGMECSKAEQMMQVRSAASDASSAYAVFVHLSGHSGKINAEMLGHGPACSIFLAGIGYHGSFQDFRGFGKSHVFGFV